MCVAMLFFLNQNCNQTDVHKKEILVGTSYEHDLLVTNKQKKIFLACSF